MNSEIRKVLETLLQMALDHIMHERFYTKRDFLWAAEIRTAADQLRTLSEWLAVIPQADLREAGKNTLPTIEEKPVLTIGQLELLNNRNVIPYTAILFYGHGGEPAELSDLRNSLESKEKTLRSLAQMLLGYMEKHFSADTSILIEPQAAWLEAALWRSRVTSGLYCIAGYYRLAAEMIKNALEALGKADLQGLSLLAEEERNNAVLLLNASQHFLLEAARLMGMAGVELGCNEDRWQRLQIALEQILEKPAGSPSN